MGQSYMYLHTNQIPFPVMKVLLKRVDWYQLTTQVRRYQIPLLLSESESCKNLFLALPHLLMTKTERN